MGPPQEQCAILTLSHLLVNFWYPQKPEEGAESPGTVVTDSCELPCECWGLNLGLREEQPMLLTTASSLQPQGTLLIRANKLFQQNGCSLKVSK